MRTVNASLPHKMPSVSVEMGNRASYQNISHEETDTAEDDEIISANSIVSQMKSSKVLKIAGVFILVVTCMLLMVSIGPAPASGNNKSGMMESVNDAAWMDGSAVGTTYCKTSCTSQCSSYFSVYGPLCCDWAEGNDGTKFCAQSVTKEGKCECGVSSSGPKTGPVDKPKPPHPAPAPAPHDDNWGFHPFPTMAWMPWDDDNKKGGGKKGGGGGGGFEPFKPFKPIKIPEHSVPCKAKCDNACGYSNGMCCDYSATGNCDMTEIDGKCYCGTD